MANTPPNDSDPKNDPNAAPEPAAPESTSAQTSTEEGTRTVHDVIAALQAEAADFKDKWLRAHAEIENVRKRAEREKEETAKYAVTRLARDIIGVGDNFQRAINAVPADAAEKDPALKSFLEGVTLTERELLNVLERHGIKRQEAMNEAFNPHLHQAVMEIPRTDVPEGTIVQVFQTGFMIEDRVLRPAMVGVAKRRSEGARTSNGGGSVLPPANENGPPG